MEEELENGIALMEGILQNWANENKGKYHIFFPRCTKENDRDVVLFPIFEENKNGTLSEVDILNRNKHLGYYCIFGLAQGKHFILVFMGLAFVEGLAFVL